MYHRVTADVAGVPCPTWNVAPERFREQLTGLLTRGYVPWPLRRVVECRRAGKPIPRHVFVVTFDDGYECVYHEAWPILKELSVPATIFVVTSSLDSEKPFSADDWEAAGSSNVPTAAWRPLRSRQCAEMIKHGLIEIGSHTHTHGDFVGRPAAFQRDLLVSMDLLNHRFGIERPLFAFPFGRFDDAMIAIARESGVDCSLTTDPRRVPLCADPFHWGRITAWRHDTAMTLAWKLRGWHAPIRSVWKWLCRFAFLGRSDVEIGTGLPNTGVDPLSATNRATL